MNKTLKQCFPNEFIQGTYDDTRAYKMRDVEVLAEFDGRHKLWPGKHKNVLYWVKLSNGYAVGFNENPARGWSFPVIKLEQKF